MTELRLPAELEQRLQQEADALELSAGDYVQLLLNTWQLWQTPSREQPGFSQLIESALKQHAPLLAQAELWE